MKYLVFTIVFISLIFALMQNCLSEGDTASSKLGSGLLIAICSSILVYSWAIW